MKEVWIFFKEVSIIAKIRILLTFVKLPALLFHELCHIIMAIILFIKINEISCNYFYIIEDDILKSYQFTVYTKSPKNKSEYIRSILISIAPLIGVLLLIYLYNSTWLILYIFISAREFFLSKQDINSVMSNIKKLKKHNYYDRFIENKKSHNS